MRGGVRTCAHGAWGRAARAAGYDALAKAEKLKPMELELRRLEDLSSSIVHNFAEMKKREAEHRDTNESTNERMLHFSIFSASTPPPPPPPLATLGLIARGRWCCCWGWRCGRSRTSNAISGG